MTVKIIDENGDRCGINVDGELRIKPRFKILGYHKNKRLTDECIDDEGFFMTGDIAHIDQDGYLHIVDRKKFMILHPDGIWVYPVKIEEILIESPEIKKVCVAGVPIDNIFEVPAAAIIRENGSKITADDVHKMLKGIEMISSNRFFNNFFLFYDMFLFADNLPKECELRGGVYFVDSIPSTRTGKPLRKAIKENILNLYKNKSSNGTT